MTQRKVVSDPYLVKSASRALDVFELLARFPEGLTLSHMSQELDIPVSSLHNIIATMLQRGYLLRDHGTLAYRLGPKLGQLSTRAHGQPDLIAVADPFMRALTRLTGESTSLSVLEGDTIVFIHRQLSKEAVQVVNPIGSRVLAHASASGKVMLACLSDRELDLIYPKERMPQPTPAAIADKDSLKATLAKARQEGFACNHEESAPGVWAVAGCIHGRGGEPIGALSLAVPTSRLRGKDTSAWARLVHQTASDISAFFGFGAPESAAPQETPQLVAERGSLR